MISPWAFIGFLLIAGFILPAIAIGLNWLLGPRKPDPLKGATYECGVETVGETWVQFRVEYYIFALIFVIFDVEAVFLFPWAVAYRWLKPYMIFEGVLFILILATGLVYLWRKKALEWL